VGGTLEERAELLLVEPIDPLDLLLLAQLNGVVGLLASASLRGSMLTRRVLAPLDGALFGVALLPLQEKLLTFSAAEPTNGTGITSHGFVVFPLDATLCDVRRDAS
jgi:hypothetical protein